MQASTNHSVVSNNGDQAFRPLPITRDREVTDLMTIAKQVLSATATAPVDRAAIKTSVETIRGQSKISYLWTALLTQQNCQSTPECKDKKICAGSDQCLGDFEAMKDLLVLVPYGLELTSNQMSTLAQAAAGRGKKEFLKQLLKLGTTDERVKQEVLSASGVAASTPLAVAVKEGHRDIARYLINEERVDSTTGQRWFAAGRISNHTVPLVDHLARIGLGALMKPVNGTLNFIKSPYPGRLFKAWEFTFILSPTTGKAIINMVKAVAWSPIRFVGLALAGIAQMAWILLQTEAGIVGAFSMGAYAISNRLLEPFCSASFPSLMRRIDNLSHHIPTPVKNAYTSVMDGCKWTANYLSGADISSYMLHAGVAMRVAFDGDLADYLPSMSDIDADMDAGAVAHAAWHYGRFIIPLALGVWGFASAREKRAATGPQGNPPVNPPGNAQGNPPVNLPGNAQGNPTGNP